MTYTHHLTLDQPYAQAVESVRAALSEQGFGIITEIDMRATFAKKLDADAAEEIGDYIILGACHPSLARRALADDGRSILEPTDPKVVVQLSDSDHVRAVADDADARLRAAMASLSRAD